MNQRSEIELLAGARKFDPDILTEIYDSFNNGIFAYAYHLLGDSQAAEDCVSETFARFLKALRAAAGPTDHLKAYLYRIAHNWITDRYRKEPVEMLELEDTMLIQSADRLEDQAETNLDLQQIRDALRTLTPEQQQVIALRFIEGWDNAEVAVVMQKPEGAVKSLQHRALATLKRILIMVDEEVKVSNEISIYG